MHTAPSAAVVVHNALAVEGVRLLTLAPDRAWPFTPGQVAELSLGPGSEGYFAIASAPFEAPPIAFLVKAEGSDSEPLMRVAAGTTIMMGGPFGAGFTFPADLHAPLLFVVAGTAIAAARSAVGELARRGWRGPIALLLGVRRAREVCFCDEIAAWHARGVAVRVCVSNEPIEDAGAAPVPMVAGRVQAQLAAFAGPDTHAFLAGSEELEDEVSDALRALGVAAQHIQRNYRPDARSSSR